MATAERPTARIDGKPNPAYQEWYRAQKAQAARYAEQAEAMVERVETKLSALKPAEPLTLRVVKLATNDRFVIAVHPTEKGKTVSVRLWKRGIGAKLLKKSIRVELRDGAFHQVR